MGTAMFGMVLIVFGFAAALGPILYGVHLTVARQHARHAYTLTPLIVEDREKLCPYCGEAVHPSALLEIERETQYEAS
jgi:hypothetical protein